MILLRLFLTFFEIGAVSFGGGYGMISMIREKVLSYGWLSEGEFLNFIAVSESTPGPLAVNMATFIGSSQAGLPGAILATLGVVLPAFFIILLIAALIRGFLQYQGVRAVLSGIRPCIVGMLLATAVTMGAKTLLQVSEIHDIPSPDLRGILIFAVLLLGNILYKKIRKKKLSPMILIAASAILGILIY